MKFDIRKKELIENVYFKGVLLILGPVILTLSSNRAVIEKAALSLLLMVGCGAYWFFKYYKPYMNYYIVIEKDFIEVSTIGFFERIEWTCVEFVKIHEKEKSKELTICESDKCYLIDIDIFDDNGLLEAMHEYLDSKVFDEELYNEKSTLIKKCNENRKEYAKQLKATGGIEIKDSYIIILIGVIAVVFFGGFALFSIVSDIPILGLLFVPFILVSLIVIEGHGKTVLSNDNIYRQSLITKQTLCWNEVTTIEIDNLGQNIGFLGNDKRMIISGPYRWRKDEDKTLDIIFAVAESKGIEIVNNNKIPYKFSKNVFYSKNRV